MLIKIIPIKILKNVEKNDSLTDLILNSTSNLELRDGDILIVAQKIISKREGYQVNLQKVIPSVLATGIAAEYDKDPKVIEVILSQTSRIVRMENGIIIVETIHGFVCANAGVDESNVKNGFVTLLPRDPDTSANNLSQEIKEKIGKEVAVIIADTFGRPFRMGQTNVAIGIAKISSILDYEGTKDTYGRTMKVTAIAIADELCSAAELVMGKNLDSPVAIIRDYKFNQSDSSVKELLRPKPEDLFR